MKRPEESVPFEARWPVALAILAVVLLLAMLPGRVRMMPAWGACVAGLVLIPFVAAVGITHGGQPWRMLERRIVLLFVLVMGAGNLVNLASLIGSIVGKSAEIPGMQLLSSSIAVWITNVLVFSLLYWQMDRGGPETRSNCLEGFRDWQFPQADAGSDAPEDWRPAFADYLFLGFTTATAFSPTEAMPMTTRAKMLMMLQSLISLVTIVVVASRAINILGS